MKKIYLTIWCLSLFLLVPQQGYSQANINSEKSDKELLKAAREIMNAAGTCALISLDDEGRPRARAMDPFPPEDDFTVWFGTNSKSRKVEQIKGDPRVTLYYLDEDQSGYVMIHGNAEMVNDKEEKTRLWKTKWETFYDEKKENYLLIKVTPLWLEVSSAKRGLSGDPLSWKPAQMFFDNNHKIN